MGMGMVEGLNWQVGWSEKRECVMIVEGLRKGKWDSWKLWDFYVDLTVEEQKVSFSFSTFSCTAHCSGLEGMQAG